MTQRSKKYTREESDRRWKVDKGEYEERVEKLEKDLADLERMQKARPLTPPVRRSNG